MRKFEILSQKKKKTSFYELNMPLTTGKNRIVEMVHTKDNR